MMPAIPSSFRPPWLPPAQGVFLVGGCVRDLLLGRIPHDFDLVTLSEARPLAESIARALGGRPVLIGKVPFAVYRVAAGQTTVDVLKAVGASIEEDLRRRDFTVNALALEASGGRLIDPAGGMGDLAGRRLAAVSSETFEHDPLRLLRAFRLAAQLDFTIAAETQAAIASRAALLSQVAGERVREELYGLLACRRAHPQVAASAAAGLLPGMLGGAVSSAAAGAESRLRTLARLEALLEDGEGLLHPLGGGDSAGLPPGEPMRLKLSALLRGKAEAAAAAARLRLSRKDAAILDGLARFSSVAGELLVRFPATSPRERYAFLQQAAPVLPGAVFLGLAIKEAEHPDAAPGLRNAASRLLSDFREGVLPQRRRPPLFRGDELQRELGIPPSRLVGRILDEIALERLLRPGLSRPEALAVARAIARKEAQPVSVSGRRARRRSGRGFLPPCRSRERARSAAPGGRRSPPTCGSN